MERLSLSCVLLLLLGRLNQYYVMATPETYWADAFPNTPIPDVIHARLHPVPSGLQHAISDNRDPRFMYDKFSKKHRGPNETTLFLEEDLKVGMKKLFHFYKSDFNNASPFLSREVADTVPFSSAEIPHILQHFMLPPASSEAYEVRGTLSLCESLEAKDKCLTSLEAMIDYTTPTSMDHNITMLHTNIEAPSVLLAYTVKKLVRKATKPNSAVCHNMPYPYAVYLCHYIGEGRIYQVSYEGEDGSMVEGIVSCHENLKNWSMPVWYQALPAGVKKADHMLACHTLPDTHIVWASD
ncbi:BURP domain-containing protein 2 [Amborella trichopoda]|uniref:BURP domain-containing protein 2 n=1 Tax=Amborella trichopoda TaxID=13333 RepID=UPI0009C01C76|nr:BURP domain-containing protein 2 [Amborella trichopoda]|eukprot:XP_011627774.2 BURP domain-containing protein 2 [Amborella trichopoda]